MLKKNSIAGIWKGKDFIYSCKEEGALFLLSTISPAQGKWLFSPIRWLLICKIY